MADMTMLDVFNDDAFGIVTLTDAINKMPFIPGQAGTAVAWEEEGISTSVAAIEEVSGELVLLPPLPRNGPGSSFGDDRRALRHLEVPHYQIDDAVFADEVQGVRQFGMTDQVRTVQGLVDSRMQKHTQLKLDPTLEYQRLGALKGVILNGDTSTLYNLFTTFGVSPPAEVDFNLDGATADGAVRQKCASVKRTIAAALGGIPFTGIRALCSANFFDALIKNVEVRATYLQQVEASQLRGGYAFGTFNFGDILWEEYRGSVGGTDFITADKCHIFPTGVAGMYRTLYAPAPYMETVNTIGLPRYIKQYPMPGDKVVRMEIQANALNYCTRPNALIQGKTT